MQVRNFLIKYCCSKNKSVVALLLVICALFSQNLLAVDPRLNWNTSESEHFIIHFSDGYAELAQKAANSAEKAHEKLQPQFNWRPLEKTHLVISDESDSANGYATPLFFNRSVIFVVAPDSASGLEDFDDWMETLITHEYTHILHLDKVAGSPEFLRKIFGRHFLLFPNVYQPNWFTEGLASWYETDWQRGTGRGQSRLYEMMMRVELEKGLKPVRQVNLPILSWPRGSVAYLYGVYFYRFIDDVYGAEARKQLMENYSDKLIPFQINNNASQVLGRDMDALWLEFSEWLKRYFEQRSPLPVEKRIEGQRLSHSGYYTGSMDMAEKDRLYYIERGPFEHAALIKRTQTEQSKLDDVLSNGARIRVHKEAGVLLVQQEYCDEYNINSDLYIYIADKISRITECGRYRSATWSADGQSIFAVRSMKAKNQLVLLTKQGALKDVLWQGEITDVVTQLRSSPQGDRIVASVFRQNHGWNIEEFDIEKKRWLPVTQDAAIDMYPSYSDNGKAIVFSSERTGRYQIYRYVRGEKRLQQLSRVNSGAFNPLQLTTDSALYYVGYHENGYDIYRLNTPQVLASIELAQQKNHPFKVAQRVTLSQPENYSPLSSLAPRWWFPYLNLSTDRSDYGLTTAGGDALGIHNYFATLAYDTNNQWFSGDFSYSYASRFAAGYKRDTLILKDGNGDFAVARNTDDFFLSLAYNDLAIESRINYIAGLSASRARDGRRASAIPEQPQSRDGLLGGAILYSNAKNYMRSISPSDGRVMRLLAETSDIIDSDYSGQVYSLDWREYINLGGQQVLALRLVQGWATDRPKPFYLGGENTEYSVFSFINPLSDSLFGNRDYALRGYAEGLPQLSGRRMQLGSLEWRFPGMLLETGWMAPPLGIIQWSGSVFADVGAAYNGASPESYYTSVGLELQADINLFYGLNSRMVLGFANGLDEQIGEKRVYFRLGSSF